jgi:hypothetical protein
MGRRASPRPPSMRSFMCVLSSTSHVCFEQHVSAQVSSLYVFVYFLFDFLRSTYLPYIIVFLSLPMVCM